MLLKSRIVCLGVSFLALTSLLGKVALGQSGTSQAQYTITDLGSLGGNTSSATGINNQGQVVGGSSVSASNSISHPFLWPDPSVPEKMKDLGAYNDSSTATGINNKGEVTISSTDYRVVLYYGYVWANNATTPLTGVSVPYGSVYNVTPLGINDASQVVGYTLVSYLGLGLSYPTLWNNGSPIDLSNDFALATHGSGSGSATAINNKGQVAGLQSIYGGTFSILWDPVSKAKILSVPPYGGPSTINTNGTLAGTYNEYINGWYPQAFTFFNGQCVSLGTLGGNSSSASGINASNVVVGNSVLADNSTTHAFIYTDHIEDLNGLISTDSGWTLTRATAINDYGQICGTGINSNGQQHAFLLTPNGMNTPVSSSAFRLTASGSDGNKQDVVGIVCDNLRYMSPLQKDSLSVASDWLTDATITKVEMRNERGNQVDSKGRPNAGDYSITANTITYYPPDEFNFEQEPGGVDEVTKAATRQVHMIIHFTKNNTAYVADKPIIVARPPVVLVHGINSNPSSWYPLVAHLSNDPDDLLVEGKGIHIPFVAVNHNDPKSNPGGLYNANGPVELAAFLLKKRIDTTLYQVHQGIVITDEDENHNSFIPAYSEAHRFSDYINIPLADKRVDIVAWSYGGVISRWYIASDGADHSQPNGMDQSWYKRNSYEFPAIPMTTYGNDVRKLITLGSMWRGVPLVNYTNEVLFSDASYIPSAGPVKLGDAKAGDLFHGMRDVLGWLGNLPFPIHSLSVSTTAPAYEVLAVNSPWESYLCFQNSVPPSTVSNASPFRDDIGYGSVAGDSDDYLNGIEALIPGSPDPYILLDQLQRPSWFPYMELEFNDGATHNYSDGLVPVWSAAIPGSNTLAPCNHSDYPADPTTQNYVALWLNNRLLRQGTDLKRLWQDVRNYDVRAANGKNWDFRVGEMAPHPENEVYVQVSGIGRINPDALREIRTAGSSNITSSSVIITWVTPTETDSRVRLSKLRTGSSPPIYDTVLVAYEDAIPYVTKIHKVAISGLDPNTTYYYDVSSVLSNPGGQDITLNSPQDGTPLPSFTTLAALAPSVSLKLGKVDLAANVFDISVTNSGGPASNFKVSALIFNASGGSVSGYTLNSTAPSSMALPTSTQTMRVLYTSGIDTITLSVKVNFQYTNANGILITGSSPYLRLK